MRLKLVATVDFRQNEATNFDALMKEHQMRLTSDEVVCMLSTNKRQIVFVYRPKEIAVSRYGNRDGTATAYHSEKLRLSRSTWEPLMLQNYAQEVGITLDGIRRFEDIYSTRLPPAADPKVLRFDQRKKNRATTSNTHRAAA
jgi:hypothetical protein